MGESRRTLMGRLDLLLKMLMVTAACSGCFVGWGNPPDHYSPANTETTWHYTKMTYRPWGYISYAEQGSGVPKTHEFFYLFRNSIDGCRQMIKVFGNEGDRWSQGLYGLKKGVTPLSCCIGCGIFVWTPISLLIDTVMAPFKILHGTLTYPFVKKPMNLEGETSKTTKEGRPSVSD